jgi:hypothetical protein
MKDKQTQNAEQEAPTTTSENNFDSPPSHYDANIAKRKQ